MITKITRRMTIAAALGAFALSAMPALADVIDDIKERGTLRVAVKADYKPYGFRDTSGAIIGIEPDLAQDVADKLGVAIEFVPVVSSNRMQFLQQGKVDLLLATMTDKPDRRKVVFIADPNYYSSGTNIMTRWLVEYSSWAEENGGGLALGEYARMKGCSIVIWPRSGSTRLGSAWKVLMKLKM